MNILHVGNAQGFENARKYYMVSQKLVNGLARLGHNVYMFNDRDYNRASNIFGSSRIGQGRLNRKLVEVCRDFAPDIVLLSHCEMIRNDTLQDIRRLLPGVRIIYVNVDPLHAPRNVEKIRRRMEVVDGTFITTAGDVLGQFSQPGAFVCFMPNPIDDSIEVGQAFARENSTDVFFAGGFVRDFPDDRRALLSELQARLGDLTLNFRGSDRPLWGRAYIDALADSKIGLCLNKTDDFHLYASDRMAQYMGNGLLVMLHRGSGFDELFPDGEIGLFSSEGELERSIRQLVSDDAMRRDRARRGWKRAHDLFSCVKIASFIVEKTLGLPLSRDYIWPTKSY